LFYFAFYFSFINFVFLTLDKPFVKHYVGYTYRAIGLIPMLSIGGQLLVVKCFKLASNYQQPELIPDPIV